MDRIEQLRSAHGQPAERSVKKIRDFMTDFVQGFIAKAPFAVLATCDASGRCDASPKGGKPGFVKVVDERTLLLPDIGGNWLFQSYGNLESNPRAALLFMIPGQNVTVRVNGRTRVAEPEELDGWGIAAEVHNPDANSHLVQGLVLTVEESYHHCPRAFAFSDLWNTRTIEHNRAQKLK